MRCHHTGLQMKTPTLIESLYDEEVHRSENLFINDPLDGEITIHAVLWTTALIRRTIQTQVSQHSSRGQTRCFCTECLEQFGQSILCRPYFPLWHQGCGEGRKFYPTCSTHGGIGPEAEEFNKRLAAFITKIRGILYKEAVSFVRTRGRFRILCTVLMAVRGFRGKEMREDDANSDINLIETPRMLYTYCIQHSNSMFKFYMLKFHAKIHI